VSFSMAELMYSTVHQHGTGFCRSRSRYDQRHIISTNARPCERSMRIAKKCITRTTRRRLLEVVQPHAALTAGPRILGCRQRYVFLPLYRASSLFDYHTTTCICTHQYHWYCFFSFKADRSVDNKYGTKYDSSLRGEMGGLR